jgi:adenine-specific DNA-methyltransferase
MEIIGFGDVSDPNFHPNSSNVIVGDCIHVYPVSEDGEERKWVFARSSVEEISHELVVKKRNGIYSISRVKTMTSYKTTWSGSKYYANIYGSKLLNNIFGEKRFDFPKSVHTVEDCLWAVASFRQKNSLCMDYFAGSGTTGHAVINLNRLDGGKRKYILIEQGEYFDTATKPRIQKVVYSADWTDGKATSPQTGISHAFKVLKLESYEDTLNNLQLRRTAQQQDLLTSLPDAAQEDYLLRYLLDIESRGSLLSVEQFNKPFDCKLKVAVDSAGAYEERSIDLVETFNYLIGLRVKHIDMQREQGFVSVTGWLPTGEKTLVLWRDVEQVDYETLSRLCDKLAINPADREFEIVYINGDHNIPAVFTSTEEEGSITKTLKLRQIEPEFLSRMFAVEGV